MSDVRFDPSGDGALAPSRQSPWWGIHAARYEFAASHVTGGRVLDIACGTGYGLPVLGVRARGVVGVDVELEAARKARARSAGGQPVIVADGTRLPFDDESFDVITSFETLEHLTGRAAFVVELRRVLRADGLAIISTPNAHYTRPVNGKPRNPHHVFEYTPGELLGELGRSFGSVELLGQTLHPRFAISPFLEDQQRLPRAWVVQARLLVWRVINKMPAAVRDRVSQAAWGHPWFPDATDYCFGADTVSDAPVLVALGRGSPAARTT